MYIYISWLIRWEIGGATPTSGSGLCVDMYRYVSIHTYIYIYISISVYLYTYGYIHIDRYIYIYIYIYISWLNCLAIGGDTHASGSG